MHKNFRGGIGKSQGSGRRVRHDTKELGAVTMSAFPKQNGRENGKRLLGYHRNEQQLRLRFAQARFMYHANVCGKTLRFAFAEHLLKMSGVFCPQRGVCGRTTSRRWTVSCSSSTRWTEKDSPKQKSS